MYNQISKWHILLGISTVFYILEFIAGGDSTPLGDLFGIIGFICLVSGVVNWMMQAKNAAKVHVGKKSRHA